MRTMCRVIGVLTALSIFSYVFLDLPLWSPVIIDRENAAPPFRGFMLLVLHFFGLIAGAVSFDSSLWSK